MQKIILLFISFVLFFFICCDKSGNGTDQQTVDTYPIQENSIKEEPDLDELKDAYVEAKYMISNIVALIADSCRNCNLSKEQKVAFMDICKKIEKGEVISSDTLRHYSEILQNHLSEILQKINNSPKIKPIEKEQYEIKINALKKEIDSLTNALREQSSALTEEQKTTDSLIAMLAEKDKQISAYKNSTEPAELNKLRKLLREKNDIIAKLEPFVAGNKALQTTIEKLRADSAKQRGELEEKSAELKRLRADSTKQRGELERLRADSTKQSAELERLRVDSAEFAAKLEQEFANVTYITGIEVYTTNKDNQKIVASSDGIPGTKKAYKQITDHKRDFFIEIGLDKDAFPENKILKIRIFENEKISHIEEHKFETKNATENQIKMNLGKPFRKNKIYSICIYYSELNKCVAEESIAIKWIK